MLPAEPTPGAKLTQADLIRAKRTLLVLGALGNTISDALDDRVGPALSNNVDVMVVTSLDIDGPQRPADIAALTGMSSGGVTKLLDRLEQQGLLAREHGRIGGDRRAIRISLTPTGKDVADRMAASMASRMSVLREALAEIVALTAD